VPRVRCLCIFTWSSDHAVDACRWRAQQLLGPPGPSPPQEGAFVGRALGGYCRCSGYRGYPGPPAPGPLQWPSFGPGVKQRPKLLEKTLTRRRLMRRTMTKTTKDQKTSSRASAGEGRDQVHVSSTRLRAEQKDEGQKTAYRPRYPRLGGDQLSPCLHKAEQWLLATPLKIAWTVQGARGGRQLPPPTPVDRRHYSMKAMSMEK
jgi:hypothetical protein